MPDTKHGAIMRLPREKLRLHPACQLVPEMLPTEWAEFLADVGRRGILEPLTAVEMPLADGTSKEYLVVDGRHRLRAAEMEEYETVVCRLIDLPSDQAAAYVIGAALHRRHLKDAQRAVIAERFRQELARKNVEKSAANARAARSAAAGAAATEKAKSQKDLRSDKATSSKPRAENGNGHNQEVADESSERDRSGDARAQAAKLFGVSERQVRSAGVIIENGCAELVKAVEQGRMTLGQGKTLAMLPLSKQRAILAGGDAAIKSALRQPELRAATPTVKEEALAKLRERERSNGGNRNGGQENFATAADNEVRQLLRLEANKLLHAIHEFSLKLQQADSHGYFAFALKHWTKERKQELADQCDEVSENMAFWQQKLLHSINFSDKEDA